MVENPLTSYPGKLREASADQLRGVRACWSCPKLGSHPCVPETFSLLLSPQFDMQRITLEELKHILYHAFRDHLTMKDIENIIINEEESLQETSENCQTEFEGGRYPCSCFLPAWGSAHTTTSTTDGKCVYSQGCSTLDWSQESKTDVTRSFCKDAAGY